MHTNSLALFKKHVLPRLVDGTRLLEVGGIPGAGHYRDAAREAGMNALDWNVCDRTNAGAGSPGVVGMADDYAIESGDSVYHAVFSAQVIEHVRKPWLWVPELARVCRQGGQVILISPISWKFHKAPTDCWRIWPDGMRALFEEAGLKEVLIVHEALTATEKEKRNQINPGPVLDMVSIGRKAAPGEEEDEE